MFIEHQLIILEGFLKDHVIVKTGVMAAGNSARSSQGEKKKSFKKCFQIENSYFKL